ncbi:MAG: lysophospholipid acyltransferase family protein [Pseudomonadota bacterium]
MIFLRSLLFNIFFYSYGFCLLTLCLPLLLGPPHWPRRVGYVLSSGMFWGLKVICNVDYEIRGKEHLPEAPYLIAAKHQSAWDTFVFSVLLKDPSFVLKRELTWLPLFGWFISRAGIVAIDREGGAAELKRMVARAKFITGRKQPLVIFPEGTRTFPDEQRPFHPGVAALYSQLNLPVVPIALNSGLFWPRRAFLKKPGTIVMEILPPVPPGRKRKAFMAELEETIQNNSQRLIAEARDKHPDS